MEKSFAATESDPRFTTHNNDGTTTCGNGTLVVTLTTEEFNRIGRYGVFNDAMRMLGNRSEAEILETEPIDPAELKKAARDKLIFDYLSEHCRYDINETLMRMNGGHRMSPGMAEDVAKARAYADGLLSPISSEDLRDWACDFFARNKCDSPQRDRKFQRAIEIEKLRLGDGRATTTLLADIAEKMERERNFEHSRRQAIGKTCREWTIEIIGAMPEQIGLCRYNGGNT